MTRYQCRACGFDGRAEWRGVLVCPHCDSATHVRAALATEEMTVRDLHSLEHGAPAPGGVGPSCPDD